MKTRAFGILFATLLLVPGCFTVGNNFSASPVSEIQSGITTAEQIRAQFGEPFRKGIDNGYESWTYVYNRWTAIGRTGSKDLYVVFNKDRTVRAYTYNSNLDD